MVSEPKVAQVSDLRPRVGDPRYGALVALTFAALLAGCGGNKSAVEQGNRDQVLHYGNGVEPSNLDPHTNTGSPESVILIEIFEGLVARGPDLEMVPAAAERWDFSGEGRIITFRLRPELKWSNGDPLTARDFRDSFKRLLEPSLAAQFAFMAYPVAGAEDYNTGKTRDFSTVGFQALDDLTFRVILDEPTPHFLQLLVTYPFLPVHMQSVARFGGAERPGTAWTRAGNLITNGPMKLIGWEANKVLTVARNEHHWNSANIALNEIRFYPIESQDTEERAFRTGQLHVTTTLPVSKIDFYREAKSPALHITPRLGANYLVFNTEKAPFDDARVRRAFALAINREQIATSIYRAGQTPAYALSQAGMGGYQPRHRITGGPEEARALLAEAGFPGGAGFPKVEYLYNTNELNRDVAQALQEMWSKELGVDVTLVNEEWKVFLNTRDLGNFQIARAGWNPFTDAPTEYFQQVVSNSAFNDSNWGDPEFDALYEKAIHTLDPAERHELYHRMDEIILRDMPVIPLVHSAIVRLVHPSVRGWKDNLLDSRLKAALTLAPGETP
ncbi:MAG TPA: peptide ABC transporter substrate-binding protein [Opitutaceae bacterium]|nr:peptide ABC transporter substrate-binding protein [Opitutaceae bacterium]